MFTNNFEAWLSVAPLGGFSVGSTKPTRGLAQARNTAGTTRYLAPPASGGFPASANQQVTLSSGGNGILLGTGTTAPTKADYKLESQITSGLASSVNQSVALDGDNPALDLVITLTNTTQADIVVTEIGYAQNLLYTSAKGGTTTSSSTYNVFLLDRTLLDSPVTVPANGTPVMIKYTLEALVS